MRIALDFDGTVHDIANPVPGRRMGPPFEDAHEHVRRLVRKHDVFWWSCLPAEVLLPWAEFYQFPHIPYVHGKAVADLYIDDRSIAHATWPDTMQQVRQLERAR